VIATAQRLALLEPYQMRFDVDAGPWGDTSGSS
jgi:hypothetical protein